MKDFSGTNLTGIRLSNISLSGVQFGAISGSGSVAPPDPDITDALIMEDGFLFLMEDGDYFQLENL
jgi:hypothetical protein